MENGEKNKDIDVVKTSEISVIEKDENDNFESHRKLSVSSISSSLSHESVSNAFSRATDTSDMRLIVEGKPLYVSRLVLSIISPVFKEMFERRARELSLFEIPLSGRKYDEMLEFLYSVYPDSLKPISGKKFLVKHAKYSSEIQWLMLYQLNSRSSTEQGSFSYDVNM